MISVKDQINVLNKQLANKKNVKENSTHLIRDAKNAVQEVIEVGDRKALYIMKCEDCEYVIQGKPIKISMENCKNVGLKVEGKVLTGTVDVWSCENVSLDSITIKMPEPEYFGSMFWAGVEGINIHLGDDKHELNYSDLQKKNPDLSSATGQFKTTVAGDGSLKTEAMVRLENGFPVTRAEEASFQRQEQKKDEVLRATQAEDDD
ncbi:hypothetical protein BGX28_000839 [Mortierella sp. GBA30]|nr:hypothetical protein BGX28_000839 [Mortierella sp. GBA30]